MIIPLTSIEKLYFFDSSPRFPNRITCRLLFEQNLNVEAAREACYWLGERHRVLGCSIEKRRGKLHWIRNAELYRVGKHGASSPGHQDAAPPKIHWFHSQELDEAPEHAPDFLQILQDVEFYRPCMLIRRWPRKTRDREDLNQGIDPKQCVSEVWFSVHHSFFDGAGGIQIANDWMQIYENLLQKRTPETGLPALEDHRFRDRNRLGLLTWNFLRLLPFQAIGLYGATKFVFRKTASIADLRINPAKSNEIVSGSSPPAMESAWLSAEQLALVEHHAQHSGYNANAKFLGDLYGVLHRWRLRKNPSASPGHWLRIILPINLRDIGDRRLPAANRSSLIQIDRKPPSGIAGADYYQSIQREIGVVQRFQLDRMFLLAIRGISAIPPLLKQVARNPKPRGLAVFTNLGRPFRRLERGLRAEEKIVEHATASSINLEPREIDFLAPLRLGTPLNFSLAKFRDRLRVTLHYDPLVVEKAEAERLVQDYLQAVQTMDAPD
jgi:hypothetical protein